ncbi:MAG: oligosaccharide flippase family protein [Bacteroidetes bacterium]|nr:oligosaccharide flippase family protein [Bacteroidota bacterium]
MNKTQSLHGSKLNSETRTKVIKRHISLTFVYKVLAIGLSYFLVPLTINYLDIEQYGIWMTLLSVMSWVVFFDIGLGNGLRNKLTEALSVNDIKLAKTYVSTAYIAISFIALLFFVILLAMLPVINWNKIFNTASVSNAELLKLVFVVGFFFLFNFVLSLCNQMFYAYQEASLTTMRQVLLNLIALVLIYILIRYTSGRLLYLGACYGLSMAASNLVMIYYFFKKHKEVIPSLKWIDLNKIKDIATLGIKFFIIQIAALVIFATDNMIITQVLGPAEVTPYNVVFKLFAIITFGYGIINAPIWSAYTNAYRTGDTKWMKNTLKQVKMIMIPIMIVVIILIALARGIVNFWVGPQMKFSSLLVILTGIYVVIQVWSSIHATFVNGIGNIKVQMYSAILAGVINIPLSIYFSKYLSMGTPGVILGTIISMSLFAIIGPIQIHYFFKNLKHKAR